MNRPKLFLHLEVRLLPLFIFGEAGILINIFYQHNVRYLFVILFAIPFVQSFAYAIQDKSEIYILSSIISFTTLFLTFHTYLVTFAFGMGSTGGSRVFSEIIIFYGLFEVFIYLLVNVFYEIGIWRQVEKKPDSKIEFNGYLKTASVLICFCLVGPVIPFVMSSGENTLASTLLSIPFFIASNPLLLIVLGYYLFKKNPPFLKKASYILLSIYLIALLALPYYYYYFITHINF